MKETVAISAPRRVCPSDALIERARAVAGMDAFGPGDWRVGLEHLVSSLRESEFEEEIAAKLEGKLVDLLVMRLRIEGWLAEHPEALDGTVDSPVFILGLPRTGTTALHALLVNDPQWRYLRSWEAASPIPPPVLADENDDPRVIAERRRGEMESQIGLGQNLHIAEPGGPADDAFHQRLHFHSQDIGWPVRSYTRWWRDCDMTDAYRYHERLLRMLQHSRPPNRWIVKAPWHNFHIDTLARQYPDARFLMCHRDPADVVPSVVSLLSQMHKSFFGERTLDTGEIAGFVLDHLAIGIGRVLDFRRRHGDERFIDVRNGDLNADPLAVIGQIYARLGTETDPAARLSMQRWIERNRKGAHGEHRYSAEQFGLERSRIREVFAGYVKRFDL